MLSQADFQEAAKALGCEVAVIKAVCEVEAPRGGFLSSGEPVILFERHIFSRITKGIYDRQASDISSPRPGGYLGGYGEHARLGKAIRFAREAALLSASWGRFQIMGFNYAAAGFKSVQEFVNAMYKDERSHLMAFVAFIKNDSRMANALRTKSFTVFARLYNGPNFAINRYDTKLIAAYRSFS